MKHLWLDRLTGQRAAAPREPAMPGQWRWLGPQRACAQPGDLLLAEVQGYAHLADVQLSFDPHLLLEAEPTAALQSFDRLEEPIKRADLDAILLTPPLLDHDVSTLDWPLEATLIQLLPALEAVCHRPRTRLDIDEERQLTSRCRRPSLRAPHALSSHPEDWEARTLFGVRPRRVLSEVRHEVVDLYENRLASGLVDRLDHALARRLDTLRMALMPLRERRDLQAVLKDNPSYRRAHRILALWGDSLTDDSRIEALERRLAEATALRRRVRALMDTSLHHDLRHLTAHIQLRMTNILLHDDLYRRVAQLWQAWEGACRDNLTDDERWRRRQQAARGFERFALLITLRALKTLRFSPGDEPWMLHGAPGTLRLRLDPDQRTISLILPHGKTLRILPLPAPLEASATTPAWRSTLPRNDDDLILHIAAPPREGTAPLDRTLHGLTPGAPGPTFVAIAPWDIQSVERLARALRWFIYAPFYNASPPALRSTPPQLAPGLTEALSQSTQTAPDGTRYLIQTPNAALTSALQRARQHEHDEAERHRVAVDALPRKDRGRQRGRLRMEEHQRKHEHLSNFESALGQANDHLIRLLACPCCGEDADPGNRRFDLGWFRCTCALCGASWGSQRCITCGRRVPFIQPTAEPLQPLKDLDTTWGCDLLAAPDHNQGWRCGAGCAESAPPTP